MIDNIKNKFQTEDMLRYYVIFAITLLLSQGFLQMHYASDTYVLINRGYTEYAQMYFLRDGRLITAFVCYMAGVLGIPFETYVVGLNCIAVIFLSLAVHTMNQVLLAMLKPEKKFHIYIITMLSFLLVMHQFSIEYQLFAESAIMCLALFCFIKSIQVWTEGSKYVYLKVFGLVLFATICYQGQLNIFPTLVFLIFILRQILHKKDEKFHYKKAFTDIAILAAITIVVILITYAIVLYCQTITPEAIGRSWSNENLLYTLSIIVVDIIYMWQYYMYMLPEHVNLLAFLATMTILFLTKSKKRIKLQYILFIVFIFVMCTTVMFVVTSGGALRINSPIAMVWGASLTIMYAQVMVSQKDWLKKAVFGMIIASFMLNSIYYMRNISEHIASNKVEHNMGMTIANMLEEYEEESGITVTKFYYSYDIYPEPLWPEIRHMGSLTEKKLAPIWSIEHTMNFYCQRKFEVVEEVERVYKDYDSFSPSHVEFYEDTIYMIVS